MRGASMRWLWLIAVTCSAAQPVGGPNGPASQPTGVPSVGRRLSLDLNVPADAKAAAAIELAGNRVTIHVTARPGAVCQWQLGYDKTVVSHGSCRLNRKGAGTFRLMMPNVRIRAEFTLIVIQGPARAVRSLTVIPARTLARATDRLKSLRLGVIDQTGQTQKALMAEGVTFENLTTRMLQDSFDGGATVLAGFKQAGMLVDVCNRFQGRIRRGMVMAVLNPPEGWQMTGVSCRRSAEPLIGKVTFSRELGRCLLPADLGKGPRRLVLGADKSCRILAWVETTDKSRFGKSRLVRHAIIVARPLGKGRIIAAAVPRAGDSAVDAVGRCTLDELVFWVLYEHHVIRSHKE